MDAVFALITVSVSGFIVPALLMMLSKRAYFTVMFYV